MWGRRMRARLSDSGAAEDRKPQPGTRQSPGYTSLPDECGSKCNSKGICGEGSACLCRLLCSTIHLRPVTPCQLMQTFLRVRGDKPQSYTSLVFLVPSHKSWWGGRSLELGSQRGLSGGRQCETGSRQLDGCNTDKKTLTGLRISCHILARNPGTTLMFFSLQAKKMNLFTH